MGGVVVVGAGVFGAWTAHHLQARGHTVTLIDAHGPANRLASSGGETRMIRCTYGSDSIYTRMAWDSLSQWQALGEATGKGIFLPTGVLYFSHAGDAYIEQSIAVFRDLKLPFELFDRGDMESRYPMIDFNGVEIGLYEPKLGVLMAKRGVRALVDRFVRDGGTYKSGAVVPPRESEASLEHVMLASGERIGGDRFVFAAGPWLPKLFPDAIGARILPTRQELFYFEAPAGSGSYLPGALPGWADFNGGDMYYGFADIAGGGVKFAHDVHGPGVDPDTQDREPSEAAIAEIVAFRDRRFPGLRGSPMVGAEVCQYENSSNGDFLIDFHPNMTNVLIVGGGSGHGFKHGPEVGRYTASLLFGDSAAEPRFSLASKSATHRREVH